jgi:hypothetical protein
MLRQLSNSQTTQSSANTEMEPEIPSVIHLLFLVYCTMYIIFFLRIDNSES